ncbi:serine/threonine-protein kinase [Pseudoteredinibacter isoporae]|uniref:Serine/threonine-protein kinase n=1 Tax=Pseudoteredinibacter isoporae TaxID=570281 RepID=A0A7X0JS00_9GAMM|nr:serine/threonine-protein kinase [Pseudoteredinibacter isoporae]MBB6520311.1 serine/threonine-protein kinase [Pseudoteredinibacter isoporae]NHO85882.1 protein kinase [Pseudoteredinibacter isoporae]NIB25666.1 protein kinase [Pseudoteredinibacter isoporae]
MDSADHPQSIANYRVQSVIGKGGMGVVYLAEDDRLQRQVAIKCINEQITDDVLTERLRHEAQLLAQLNHPNVVQVYDFIDDGENLALVMEYVEGRTLRQYMRENLCDQKQKLLFLAQIADGLAAAHNAGIVHRDLKLDNVLVNRKGLLKLTDFGIAKSQDPDVTQLTQHDAVSGSYSAMSPEQICGEKVGPGSDLFAFGILAWRMFLGRHPFGDEAGQLLMVEKILNNEPEQLCESETELPAELCQLIDKLLIKDPKQRPSNAAWLARQLQILLPQVSDELSGEMTAHNILRSDYEAPSRQSRYLLRFAKVLSLACMLGLSAFAFIKFKPLDLLFAKPVTHIAVIEPELEGEQAEQYRELQASLFLALQDSVRSLDNSQLVSPKEVRSARRSGGKLGAAVGADIVLSSQLQCQLQRCQLTLSKLAGKRWTVLKQDRLTLVHKNLLDAHASGQEAVRKLFGATGDAKHLSEVVSEEDYQLYLDIRRKKDDDPRAADQLLDQLEAIQRRAPRFDRIYSLYADISLTQQRRHHHGDYLNRLRSMLEKAPAPLSQSIFYQKLWFELYLKSEEYSKAIGSIEVLDKLKLDRWVSERMRAQVALAKGENQEAIRLFQERLAERSSSQAYRNLAMAYWKDGNKELAIQNLKSSLTFSPESVQSHSLLASIFLSSGDLAEAKAIYETMLDTHPVEGVYESMGLLSLLERNYEAAIDYFSKAKALKPNDRLYTLYLGDSYLLADKEPQAKTQYRLLSEMPVDEDNAKEHSYLARALIQQGQTMDALRVLQKAQTLDARDKSVAFASALVYSKVENTASGLLWIETSLELGIEKNWFALPWFDSLCNSSTSAQDFESVIGLSCPIRDENAAVSTQ